MRRLAAGAVLMCAVTGLAEAQGQAAAPVAIVGVTVIDMTGAPPKAGQTVVVRDGRIVAVGSSRSLRPPANAVRVDGRGKFVIPGLWDMHVHTSREGRARYFWPLFLAHGVTGVREMGSYLDTLLAWRAELRRKPESGPRIIWSSPMFDGSPPAWKHGLGLSSPEEGRRMVDSMRSLGFDFIKVYARLPRPVYDAIAAQAKQIGMPFAGHVPGALTALDASAAGQRSIEHNSGIHLACAPGAAALNDSARALRRRDAAPGTVAAAERRFRLHLLSGFDEAACSKLFAAYATNGTWQVPTLVVLRGSSFARDTSFHSDARRLFAPPSLVQRWRAEAAGRMARGPAERLDFDEEMYRHNLRLVGAMHRADVRVLAGTDASDEPWVYAGASLLEELELLVAAGLSPMAALAAGTSGPAEYLGVLDSLGTIEPGKLADMVILDADPLADIANVRQIHAVVFQGRLMGPAVRDSLLRVARAEAARAVPSPPADQ